MSAYLLESAFCLILSYGFYHVALRRETFFQWNRAFLLLAPLLALALPALHIQVSAPAPPIPAPVEPATPTLDLPTLVAQVQTTPIALRKTLEQPVSAGWSLSVAEVLWGIYLLGMVLLLGRLALRFWRLKMLLRRCRREQQGLVTLAIAETEDVPLSSFFGTVFWKRATEFTEKEQLMFAHELVHVRQWHSLDVLWMEMLVVVQWFNPLIHAFRHSLCAVHEYIADDYVVRQTRQRYQYATLLAEQATTGSAQPGVLVNTFHSLIKHRLLMLAKRPSRPLQRAKYLLALPLFAALTLLFSFRLVDRLPVAAPFRAVTQAVEDYFTQLDALTVVAKKPIPPTPPADPTPYIFYWGQVQCNIEHTPATGAYSGEITLAPDLFRECLKREPRLYNGRSLEQKLAFSLNSLPVQSDYNDETVYAAGRTKLEDYIATLQGNEYLELQGMRLPNGGNCTIRVYIGDKSPQWFARQKSEDVSPKEIFDLPGGEALPITWGNSPYDPDRQFYTLRELWEILDQDPFVMTREEGTKKLEGFQFRLFSGEPRWSLIAMADNPDSALNLSQLRLKLHDIAQLQPGTLLILESSIPLAKPYQVDTIRYLFAGGPDPMVVTRTRKYVKVGSFEIVPENDLRLQSRRSDKMNFKVKWGNYSSFLNQFYAKSLEVDRKIVYYDHVMSSHNFSLTRNSILNMVTLPLEIYREDQLLPACSFDITYKNHKTTVQNGLLPADFVQILENELQPYDIFEITELQSGSYTLNTMKITFEVKPNDPKPPLRPANTPAVPVPVINLAVAPNPVSEKTIVTFDLTADIPGSLRITDVQGKLVWTTAQDFVSGRNRIDLAPALGELKTAGVYFIQLETAIGTGRQSFIVQ